MSAPSTIVVTHDGADLDGFAAAVAVQRLEPGAAIVLSPGVAPDLRAYLAVHRGRFPTVEAAGVEVSALRRVVMVDVRRASRIAGLGALGRRIAEDRSIEVAAWDHHGTSADDVPAAEVHVAAVGAATTLLVEALQARGLAIDAAEATLFALGIHADTGSLTYAGTTARDAAAVATALAAGARLGVLGRELTPALSAGQRRALVAALEGLAVRRIGGIEVGFTQVELDRGIAGLDVVTSQTLAAAGTAALFAIYGLAGRGRAIVVARARPGTIDVRPAMAALGGGGHAGAGTATVRGRSAGEIEAAIAAAIAAAPSPAARVAALMSAPARVAAPGQALAEVDALLRAWGCGFAPIVREGRLVGSLSRGDVARALARGRGELPAASCMRHHVATIEPSATIDEALARMGAGDLGHLAVVEGEALVGVVSRSDLLVALYGDGA